MEQDKICSVSVCGILRPNFGRNDIGSETLRPGPAHTLPTCRACNLRRRRIPRSEMCVTQSQNRNRSQSFQTNFGLTTLGQSVGLDPRTGIADINGALVLSGNSEPPVHYLTAVDLWGCVDGSWRLLCVGPPPFARVFQLGVESRRGRTREQPGPASNTMRSHGRVLVCAQFR